MLANERLKTGDSKLETEQIRTAREQLSPVHRTSKSKDRSRSPPDDKHEAKQQ